MTFVDQCKIIIDKFMLYKRNKTFLNVLLLENVQPGGTLDPSVVFYSLLNTISVEWHMRDSDMTIMHEGN